MAKLQTARQAAVTHTQHARDSLSVVIRLQEKGPEMTREPLTEGDLSDAQSELWLQGVLRQGFPDLGIDQIEFRINPLVDPDRSVCHGFAVECITPDQTQRRIEFTIHAAETATWRAVQRLLASGMLQVDDSYHYHLVVDSAGSALTPPNAAAAFPTTNSSPQLDYLTVPLPPLLAKARSVGTLDQRWYHVLYTQGALEKAERYARKGAERRPPIESGAVLTGPLCVCPESGEFYAVVCDALEVQDAEESEFSLTYTGKSWSRIQAILRAWQQSPTMHAQRALGQSHGHNFLPANGAPPCELCDQAEVCSRTSVFVSQADRTWSRAVFSRQPWQLCHIFGLNARNQTVHTLFGLRDGRLLERGYHIIPEFEYSH